MSDAAPASENQLPDRQQKKLEKRAAREAERIARDSARSAAFAESAATQAALDARTGKKLFHPFGTSIYVFENEVWKGKPDGPLSVGGSIAGAVAEVEIQGQSTQRLTATRMVTLGVFSLAAPKKTGNQTLSIKVSAPGYRFTYTPVGDVTPMQIRMWNQVADMINNRGLHVLPAVDAQPATAFSAADELAKFAQLHAQGVLTDEEFAAKKAELLA